MLTSLVSNMGEHFFASRDKPVAAVPEALQVKCPSTAKYTSQEGTVNEES